MTIDEEIEHAREVAEKVRKSINSASTIQGEKTCIKCAEEHEQLVEWLEELKCYKNDNDFSDYADRLHKIAFNSGYNKALDDFVKFANTMPTVEEEDGTIRPMWLEEIAEQLKAGGEIETDNK